MKIAITSTGKTLDAQVDQRFGRAQLFLVLDTETDEIKVVDNQQNLNAAQGAGIQAAETVVNQEIEVLITGHCGPNAYRTLQAAGVKIVTDAQGTVGQMVEKFKKGELGYAQDADVPGHWS
ncbi:NifB/NifX family molybdenum-iron cluster-binding protein [bacterium]|nr:NifB/NifX family molybdenum-iron cluster-binding protein [bacterium]